MCVCCRYWEAVLELLWPRFELILEMNIQSIRNTDPQKLGILDTRPHYVRTHMTHMMKYKAAHPSRSHGVTVQGSNQSSTGGLGTPSSPWLHGVESVEPFKNILNYCIKFKV